MSVIVGLSMSACGSGTDSSSPTADTATAAVADLREKAKDAYIFTYSLVMNYRTMYKQAIECAASLEGNRNYRVTFPAGQEPPVRGFWSLTLYNDKHLFHPNALNAIRWAPITRTSNAATTAP